MNLARRHFLGLGGASLLAGVLPAAEKPKHPSVVFYTDVHARAEWDTPLALREAAAQINGLTPDAILCGGDLVTDGFQAAPGGVDARWEVYLDMHRSLRAPVWTVPGNHDLVGARPENAAPAADARAEFRDRLGVEDSVAVHELGDWRILLLDSVHILPPGQGTPYEGRIAAEQLGRVRAWLEDVPKDQPILLMSHMPLLSVAFQATAGSEIPPPKARLVVNNLALLDLFAGHRLTLVLQGHLHVYENILWRGTRFITGGALCGKWWRGDWHGTPPGFCQISLDPDDVACRYVPTGWQARRP